VGLIWTKIVLEGKLCFEWEAASSGMSTAPIMTFTPPKSLLPSLPPKVKGSSTVASGAIITIEWTKMPSSSHHTICNGRTIMIYAALWWPEHNHLLDLWLLKTMETKDVVILKLHKSLCRNVQVTCTWYHHLQKGLNKLDFHISTLDPDMYNGQGMILIMYVDEKYYLLVPT
jgi:hypothetical protein